MVNNHNKCFINGDTNHESKDSSEFAFELKSFSLLATNNLGFLTLD